MNAAAALAALLLLSAPARAADAPPLADMAPRQSSPGWARQGSSLLLYGADGGLLQELPLSAGDDGGSTTRETLGGVAPDGTLSWTLERKTLWKPGRRGVLESQRLFRLYGGEGRELWRDDAVDAPERGETVAFSTDAKSLLIARRAQDGWQVELRSWLGAVRTVAGPFPRLIAMALTPNGRFVLARWAVPDKSDTHSFVDVERQSRRDVPSSDLTLGLARIDDEGTVRSGSRVIFTFKPEISSGTAPGAPPSGGAP